MIVAFIDDNRDDTAGQQQTDQLWVTYLLDRDRTTLSYADLSLVLDGAHDWRPTF